MALIDLPEDGGSRLPPAGGTASVAAVRPRGSMLLVYMVVVVVYSAALLLASVVQNRHDFGAVGYCILLFAICAGPGLMGRHNPRHRLLSVFMGCYFAIFGLYTTTKILTGSITGGLFGPNGAGDAATQAYTLTSDAVVIFGILALLGGYFLIAAQRRRQPSTFLDHEWRYPAILAIGVLAWSIGFGESIAYQLNVSPLHIPKTVMGLPLGIASNIRLLSPIGGMMLIYLVARRHRLRLVWPLLLLVMGSEFVFGFIGNSKEVSFRIPVLLLLGLYFFQGQVNRKVLLTVLIIGAPYLLFFNAYRTITLEHDYKTPAEALQALGRNLEAVRHQTTGQDGVASSSLESFTQRVDGKVYIDIIVAGTDSGRVQRLGAESLWWFFESFIPSFLWPEKPDIVLGQRFNHEFHLSESQYTFVPTTQLGELYWDFGMPGAILGMAIIGAIFSWLSAALLEGAASTVPRFMMLLMSTYYLVVRFEDNIANQYSVFVRLMILIWVGDRLLRLLGMSVPAPAADRSAAVSPPAAPPLNLLTH
jgi:hypothetical protein